MGNTRWVCIFQWVDSSECWNRQIRNDFHSKQQIKMVKKKNSQIKRRKCNYFQNKISSVICFDTLAQRAISIVQKAYSAYSDPLQMLFQFWFEAWTKLKAVFFLKLKAENTMKCLRSLRFYELNYFYKYNFYVKCIQISVWQWLRRNCVAHFAPYHFITMHMIVTIL